MSANWSKVTLEQFSQLREALHMEDKVDKMVHVLKVMEGKEYDSIMTIDLNKLRKDADKWLPLLETTPEGKLRERVNINGRWYRFILNINKLSAGQYIDVMEFLKRAGGNEDKVYQYLPDILASICVRTRKKWRRWKDESYQQSDEIKEDMKQLPMDFVYPLSAFFLNLWTLLMLELARSSTGRLREAIATVEDLLKSGDGLSPSTLSQARTLIDGIKLQAGQLENSLTPSVSSKTNRRKKRESKIK